MRKLLSVFIAVCLVLSLFTEVFAPIPSTVALTEGVWIYTVAGGKATITGYTGPNAVVIPASLGTSPAYPVTTIGGWAFYPNRTTIVSVIIPNSVTSIGDSAFHGCMELTVVIIPNSVISIGESAFYGCTGLTSVTIGTGVTIIDQLAFYGCSKLAGVIIPDSVINIAYRAFTGCSAMTSVTLGNSLTSIGGSAFSGCSKLTGVSIPDSVTVLGDGAFTGCSAMTSVTLGNSLTSIGGSAFSGCSKLTSVIIPDSVTSLGTSAFQNCSGLTSVIIPDSVTSLGTHAFDQCTGLTSLTIGSGVTSIAISAFYGCTGLTSVIIPETVTSLGTHAFYGCTKLITAYFLGNAPSGTSDMFTNCGTGFTVWYLCGKTGWTDPWYGYSTANNCSTATDLVLSTSWNLVSVSVPLPASSIPGLQAVYGYHDGWSVPTTNLVPGEAYWVQVQNAVTVPLPGTPSTAPASLTYQAGWQLLGNPFDVPLPVTSITNHSLITTCYSYGPTWGSVDLTTGVLQPGKGYWIQLSAAMTLTLAHP